MSETEAKNNREKPASGEFEPIIVRRVTQDHTGPRVISFLSGKGGTGQSMLVANIGVYLAQTGKKVLLVDAVRWGQNLHTFLGIPAPKYTLDVLKEGRISRLEELINDTPFGNLKLLCGLKESSAALPVLEAPYLIQAIRNLPFDFVILDLGCHLSFSVFDHSIWADYTTITTMPEPIAIERTYELLRGLYYRIFKTIENKLGLSELVEKAMVKKAELGVNNPQDLIEAIHFFNQEAGDHLVREMNRYQIRLLLNQIRSSNETEVGSGMSSATRKYFGLNLSYLGQVDYDSVIPASIRQRKPLHMIQKESNAAKQIEEIAHNLLSQEIRDKQDKQR